jgi:SlyX protein
MIDVDSKQDYRLNELEIQLAHLTRSNEDLSDVVARQTKRIEVLEKRLNLLLDRAREQEMAGSGGHVFGDEQPPHW